EAVEERREVHRRLRALDRDRVAARDLLALRALTLTERDVALADEIAEPAGRGGSGREPVALLEREGDPRLPFVEDRDLLDLSHADTRDADVVALVEGGDVGEDRVELRS